MVDRIAALKIPVTFVCKCFPPVVSSYALMSCPDGDQDWMDPEGGKESVERLRQAGNGLGKMYIVPHAGHHGMFRLSYTYPLMPIFSQYISIMPRQRTTCS